MASATTAAPTHQPGDDTHIVFKWKRYWVPLNTQIMMSGFWDESQGFLADPENELLGKYSNKHLRATDDLLRCQPGCIVLCGEPGMGKSQTLRSHFESVPTADVLHVEFRDIPDSGRFERMTLGTPRWVSWRAGNETLILVVDGVDEGLIKIAGFVDYLTGLLREEPINRLQVILACRSLEWPLSEGQRLLGLWPSTAVSGVFELCPLRDKDARLAAEVMLNTKNRRSIDAFMRAVRQNQLIGLATRPLTLRMLLHEFQSGGKFSKTHRELYRRFSNYLAGEYDDARKKRLRNQTIERLHVSPAQRGRIAGRIAALMLICGRSAIWPGNPNQASSSDLSISEICEGPERLAGVEFTVTPTMVEAVLESALFWPRENGRAGFYHQTFAESLAAEYLNDLPFPQKRTLLCCRDRHGEFVHPPLAELASWMAADSEELLAHLLAHDPETLLRSDVSAIKETSKVRLVNAILVRAAAGDLFDNRGSERFFHTLKHPKLAAQLRPIIRDRTKNHVVRRIAFKIAEACALTSLMPDALALLRNAKDCGIHSVAASAIDDLFDAASGEKVAAFLCTKRGRTLSAGVQVSLLHALLRNGYWTLSQALPHTNRALRDRDSAGYILAQHAGPSDAEALLRACLRWNDCFDTLSRYHQLVVAAHDLGLARINEPKIRQLLGRVWLRANSTFHDFRGSREEAAPSLLSEITRNENLRHQFITDLILLQGVTAKKRGRALSDITTQDDFEWLLTNSLIGSQRRRRAFAHLAARCYNWDTHAPYWDALLDGLKCSPELREAFPWLRLWDVNAADSLKAKETFYEYQRMERETEVRRRKTPPVNPIEVWNRDLAALENEKPEHWMNLAHHLFYRSDAKSTSGRDRVDVRTSPGWQYHGMQARTRIIDGARRLIMEVPGNPQHAIGQQSSFDEHAYKALYLLKDEIENNPLLADMVRKYWLPTIFDEFSNADVHHLEMMSLGYRLDGDAMRTILRQKIVRDASQNEGLSLELREFGHCWDQAIADFAVELAATEITNPRTVACIAEYLAEHDVAAALALWRRLQGIIGKEKLFVAVTAALVSWRLLEVWDEVWPILRFDTSIARDVFLGFDPHDQRKFLQNLTGSAESHLADLYLYLRELFPLTEDPPHPVGAYTPTRRMEIARLRDELPRELVSIATDAAADALLRIANAVPAAEALWIRWRWHEAVVAIRRKNWKPPSPAHVLELMRKATARFLTDEDDLLTLVLESLERLDDNLTQQPNSSRKDYWNPVRKGRNGKKYMSPSDEVEMSRRVTTWLQSDLAAGRGITIQREVQVQWNLRTDIEVRAVAVGNAEVRPLEIVVEVKGCWHAKVRTAATDQLVMQYLKKAGWTHGIYLVIWTECAAWNDPSDARKVRLKAKNLPSARREVADLVRGYDGTSSPYRVVGLVLDARL